MKKEDIESRERGFLNQEDERAYKVFKFKNVPSQYSKNLGDDKWKVNPEFDVYKLNEDAYMKPLYEKYKERIAKDIKTNKMSTTKTKLGAVTKEMIMKSKSMLIEEKEVKRMMRKLAKNLEDKAQLDMFNEVGFGNSGFSPKREYQLNTFDSGRFIKEEIERFRKRKYK